VCLLAVWDSSIVMAKFFEHHSAGIQNKQICDLSAGTGLVGVLFLHLLLETFSARGQTLGHLQG
jgi:predicted nicotinamide N-methyase